MLLWLMASCVFLIFLKHVDACGAMSWLSLMYLSSGLLLRLLLMFRCLGGVGAEQELRLGVLRAAEEPALTGWMLLRGDVVGAAKHVLAFETG